MRARGGIVPVLGGRMEGNMAVIVIATARENRLPVSAT